MALYYKLFPGGKPPYSGRMVAMMPNYEFDPYDYKSRWMRIVKCLGLITVVTVGISKFKVILPLRLVGRYYTFFWSFIMGGTMAEIYLSYITPPRIMPDFTKWGHYNTDSRASC